MNQRFVHWCIDLLHGRVAAACASALLLISACAPSESGPAPVVVPVMTASTDSTARLTDAEREEIDFVARRAEERLGAKVSLTATHLQTNTTYQYEGSRVAATAGPLRLPLVVLAMGLLSYANTPRDVPIDRLIARGDSMSSLISAEVQRQYAPLLSLTFDQLMQRTMEPGLSDAPSALLAFIGGRSQFDRGWQRYRLPAIRSASVTSDALAELMRRQAFIGRVPYGGWGLARGLEHDQSPRRVVAGVPFGTRVQRVADEWLAGDSTTASASDVAIISLPGQRGKLVVAIVVSEATATPQYVDAAIGDVVRTLYLAWTR